MSQLREVAGIVLAAGKGTRMKSELPKALHEVCGAPMVRLVADALISAGVGKPIIVTGHGSEAVREALGADRFEYAFQQFQRGTGDAVRCAIDSVKPKSVVIVAAGDTPLVHAELVRALLEKHTSSGNQATVATMHLEDPTGYGRVLRDPCGNVTQIVEHRDATQEQREILEANGGLYCFDSDMLGKTLEQLRPNNDQGELYLTDTIAWIASQGGKVGAYRVEDPIDLAGVNNRWQLAEANSVLRRRLVEQHALAGVSILDPASTYVDVGVEIGRDTVLHPGSFLEGSTRVGERCSIGPNTQLIDSRVGSESRVMMSVLHGVEVGRHVIIGPFAHLRGGASIGDDARIGNFVEVKNSALENGVRAAHLSYIGDASVGRDANIGAGTITCNYDGICKHRTVIGAEAFIGSNSTLVAPVQIGHKAIVAAGSVVTFNVPDDALAVGRSRQEIKESWATQWREKKRSKG